MSESEKKVAVIGAGHIGLLFSRLFWKKGYNVTIFERRSEVGGMWNFQAKNPTLGYDELNIDGSTECCYSAVLCNTSKYAFLSTDALPDDEIVPHDCHWMNIQQVLGCLKNAARNHNLLSLINFHTEVGQIDKVGKKGWKVSFKKMDSTKVEEEIFDFVLCCSGGFRFPRMPELPNMDAFKGIAIHSGQIRLEDVLFANRKVLVYGGGFSGIDIANYALKNKAKKVYWSLTRGNEKKNIWMVDHNPEGKKPDQPWDLELTRYTFFEKPLLAYELCCQHFKPVHHELNRPLTLPGDKVGFTEVSFVEEQLKNCKLEKVEPIKSITEDGAELRDGRKLDVDVIVYCTGYEPRFPVVDHIWKKEEQVKNETYYHMLPVQKELQGVAFLGGNDATTANCAMYECSARWLADFWGTRTYDEEGQLFTAVEIATMTSAIEQVKSSKEAHISYNHISMIDLTYTLAKDIGCLPPNYRKLIRSGNKPDVELGISLLHGPLTSGLQYRISGNMILNYAAEEFIKLTKRQLGQDVFYNMVEKALHDPEKFFSDAGINKEETVIAPYCDSILAKQQKK